VKALSAVEERTLEVASIEAAVLDRNRSRRKFRRLTDDEVSELLPKEAPQK